MFLNQTIRALSVAIVMAGVVCASASGQDRDQLLAEGVSLHDAGNYQAAIQKYEAALRLNANDSLALYELANTYSAMGDYDRCLSIAEKGLKEPSDFESGLFTVAGSCLSMSGEAKKALKMFRKGLKKYPDDVALNFNIAITLANIGDLPKAKKHLKRTIELEHTNRSAFFVLAKLMQAEGNRVPAILCYLRFLTLELGTPRSQEAAKIFFGLMHVGVVEESDKKVTINLNPDSPKNEGDFTATEFLLSLIAAKSHTEEERNKPAAQKAIDGLTEFLSILEESKDEDLRQTFVWKESAEFLFRLKREGLLEPYAYVLVSEAGVKGAENQIQNNPEKIDRLVKWLQASFTEL